MKNLVGYTPLSNPDWISLKFDDGSESTPVNDPGGAYRAEVDQIAKKIAGAPPDPMANATASVGAELIGSAGTAVSKSDAATPVSGLGDFRIIEPPAGTKPAQEGGDAGLVRRGLATAMRVDGPGGMPAGGAPAATQRRPGSARDDWQHVVLATQRQHPAQLERHCRGRPSEGRADARGRDQVS